VKTSVPRYMHPGSRGPAVTLLQAFLCGAGFGRNIEFGEEYEPVTVLALQAWQENQDLDPNDHCGPDTRTAMLDRYGFNFDEACETIRGETIFVQPDGKKTLWSPETYSPPQERRTRLTHR